MKYIMKNKKPIKIEAYECPKCHAKIIGNYATAKSHIDILEDAPLPNGFAYFSSDRGCVNIIYGAGHLSSDTCDFAAHAREQPIRKYSLLLGMMLHCPVSYVNSRVIRDSIEKGILKILPENLLSEIQTKSRMLETEKGERLILQREI